MRAHEGKTRTERAHEGKTRTEKALLFLPKLCYTAMNENKDCKRIYEQKEILVF